MKITKPLKLLFLVLINFGCNKILHKNQLLDQDGKWIIKEQRIKVFYNANNYILLDTTLYDVGYFNFQRLSKKEKKELKDQGSEYKFDGGYVSSFYMPSYENEINTFGFITNYELTKYVNSGSWRSKQIPGFKPKFFLNLIETTVTKSSEDKQEFNFTVIKKSEDENKVVLYFKIERE